MLVEQVRERAERRHPPTWQLILEVRRQAERLAEILLVNAQRRLGPLTVETLDDEARAIGDARQSDRRCAKSAARCEEHAEALVHGQVGELAVARCEGALRSTMRAARRRASEPKDAPCPQGSRRSARPRRNRRPARRASRTSRTPAV